MPLLNSTARPRPERNQRRITDAAFRRAATEKLLTKDEARRIAANIAKLPEVLRKQFGSIRSISVVVIPLAEAVSDGKCDCKHCKHSRKGDWIHDSSLAAAVALLAGPLWAQQRTPTTVVACSGAFAKNSTDLKLAMYFDSKNITFTDVEYSEGSKVPASVLFPNDPKRRLEVWVQYNRP